MTNHKTMMASTILFSSITLVGCQDAVSNPTEPMPITPVKLLAIESTMSQNHDAFLAQIDATQRAQLSFQAAGQVQALNVRMGQRVSKGELLATLDARDLQLALEATQASYELAKSEWERSQRLYEKQLVSADHYDQSETRYKAELAHFQQAQTELSHTKLIAPFAGVVSSTFAKPSQVVAAKQQILNLIDNQQLDVSFTLPVSYVDQIGYRHLSDKTLAFVLDSEPSLRIVGELKEISTKPNTDTNSYQATMTIQRPQGRNLLSGMTGQVLIERAPLNHSIALPSSAWISKQQDTGTVWLMNPSDHRVTQKTVQLDRQGNVVAGLNREDWVVIAGVETLVEGQEVKAWRREEGI